MDKLSKLLENVDKAFSPHDRKAVFTDIAVKDLITEAYYTGLGENIEDKPIHSSTKVHTKDGMISLSNVKNGDEVLCADGCYHNIKLK